ncbi:MAG TPA: hypothetical protein VIK78_02980 [Ruminiclostridium sp.]
MAAPHVTGDVALLLSTPARVDTNGDGICIPNEVKERVESTTIDLGVPGKYDFYGFGLINVFSAIN